MSHQPQWQPQQTVYVTAPRQSQALPALASFFVPGLGQLIQGRLVAAVLFFGTCVTANVIAIMTLGLGLILSFPLWLWCIVDAAKWNDTRPHSSSRSSGVISSIVLVVAIFGGLFLVGILVLSIASVPRMKREAKEAVKAELESRSPQTPTLSSPASNDNLPNNSSPDESSASEQLASVAPSPEKHQAKPATTLTPTRKARWHTPKDTDLVVESWHWESSHGFVEASGEVTNNTAMPLDNVVAVVKFATADGTLVKSSEAVISYNPILAGQTSPFETITTSNPEIKTASLSFKFLLGGTIPSITRERFDAPSPAEIAAKRQAEEDAARAKVEAKEREKTKAEAARWRTWTSANGKFTLKAKFISYGAGRLRLEKEDGESLDVKLNQLCDEDQEFVKGKKWLELE